MTHNIAQLIETGQDEKIAALEAEVAELRRDRERMCELGRLVFAMPAGSTLSHENSCDGPVWSLHIPARGTWHRDTPAIALIAAGVGQEEEEPCQST